MPKKVGRRIRATVRLGDYVGGIRAGLTSLGLVAQLKRTVTLEGSGEVANLSLSGLFDAME